jgi:hypothetical protein
MDFINFYTLTKKEKKFNNPQYNKHKIEIPFRMCISAPSGSGKTSFLCNILTAFDNTFYQIVICLKNKAEPLYEMIEEKLNKKSSQVVIYEDGEIPKLTNYGKDGKPRLIVFDDLLYDNQSEIKQYFIRGRKVGHFSCIYISQSYFKIPKDIRVNCQYIVLGRNLLKRDLNIILQEISSDLSLDELMKYYSLATEEPMHVLFIDLVNRNLRHNLYKVIAPLNSPLNNLQEK